jgi:hypothetical protein
VKPANKGKHNGECNRTACRVAGLQVCMWSFTEHAYYCVDCSKEIERWSGPLGVKPMEAHSASKTKGEQ